MLTTPPSPLPVFLERGTGSTVEPAEGRARRRRGGRGTGSTLGSGSPRPPLEPVPQWSLPRVELADDEAAGGAVVLCAAREGLWARGLYMTPPVYSTQLVAAQNFSGDLVVPIGAGVVVVVRDLDVYFGGLTGATVELVGSAGQIIDAFSWEPLSSGTHQWRGRQVFTAGQTITLRTNFGCDLSLSGYVLSAT